MDYRSEIKRKIEDIHKKQILPAVVYKLSNNLSDMPEISISSRIKDVDSAVKKYEYKGYDSTDKLTDLAGIMVITKNEEDVYKVVDFISNNYVMEWQHDYIKKPNNGYQSFHTNIYLNNMNIEVQIKTQDMHKAQNFIHDSLYKNYKIKAEDRAKVMKPLFPILKVTPSSIIADKKNELYKIISRLENSTAVIEENLINNVITEISEVIVKSLNQEKLLLGKMRDNKIRELRFIEKESDRQTQANIFLKSIEHYQNQLKKLDTPYLKLKRVFSHNRRYEQKHVATEIDNYKNRLKKLNIDRIEDRNKLKLPHNTSDHNFIINEIETLKMKINGINKVQKEISTYIPEGEKNKLSKSNGKQNIER